MTCIVLTVEHWQDSDILFVVSMMIIELLILVYDLRFKIEVPACNPTSTDRDNMMGVLAQCS